MIVLGIDPGTATTGFALLTEDVAGNAHLERCGVIQTTPSMAMPDRLSKIYAEVCALIEWGKPDAVAVEELFFKRNVSTALTVGQARGVILLAAAQAGAAVFEYKPSEIKLALVGYGSATKVQVQEMVRMLLDLPAVPRPDDAADAVAIAICHLHSARLRSLAA